MNAIPRCLTCSHWTQTVETAEFLIEDRYGVCDGIRQSIDIQVETGSFSNGYSVESVETPINFFCANHSAFEV